MSSKNKIYLFGLTALLSNNIVLYITFIYAYFYNNYLFSFDINRYGEAHLEFILLTLTLIIGGYVAVKYIRRIIYEERYRCP